MESHTEKFNNCLNQASVGSGFVDQDSFQVDLNTQRIYTILCENQNIQ